MGQGKKMKKDKEVAYKAPQNKQQKKPSNPECTSCFFCRAEEHKKKHCTNYHTWCDKKIYFLICIFLRFIYLRYLDTCDG